MASSTLTHIPLRCDLCPKKPRFSDVSHLLTHISSKTHLSNQFKARVRADVDTESRRLVEDYDQWYAEWNIQDLLAERLTQKDNKISRPRGRGKRKRAASTESSATMPPRETSGHHQENEDLKSLYPGVVHAQQQFHPYTMRPLPNIPSLYMPTQMWAGLNQGGGYDALMSNSRGTNSNAFHSPFQHGYPTTSGVPPVPASLILPSQPENVYPDPQQFALPLEEQTFKKAPGPRRRSKRVELRSSTQHVKHEDAISAGSSTDLDNNSEPPPSEPNPAIDTIEDIMATPIACPRVALKGMVYPGMDCHDAATPDQRVQRNQRKSSEQYSRLEASSITSALSPHEVVFAMDNGHLVYNKQHEITVQPAPSELGMSSPEPDFVEVKKRRAPKQRYANKESITKSQNMKVEEELEHGVAFARAKRQFSVFTGEGSDSQSVRTCQQFASGFQPRRRFPIDQEQENTHSYADTPASTTKSDDNGLDSRNRIVPSIENSAEQGIREGLPRHSDVVFDFLANTTATQLPYSTVNATPGAFASLNNHSFVDANPANESTGTSFSDFPHMYSHLNGPAYSYPFPQDCPDTSNVPNLPGVDTHNRLNNLATVASRDHHLPALDSMPAFRTHGGSAYQANTFPGHLYGHSYLVQQPSGSYNAQLSPNREWTLPPPMAPSLGFPFNHHGHHSNTSANFGQFNARQFDLPELYIRPNEEAVDHIDSTLPPFLRPNLWNLDRTSNNCLGVQDPYGFGNVLDNQDNQQALQYIACGLKGNLHGSNEHSEEEIDSHISGPVMEQRASRSPKSQAVKHALTSFMLGDEPVVTMTDAKGSSVTTSSLSDFIEGEIDEDRTVTAPCTPKNR